MRSCTGDNDAFVRYDALVAVPPAPSAISAHLHFIAGINEKEMIHLKPTMVMYLIIKYNM